MAEVENNNISVIKQKDPNLPEYLDFEKLRKQGLEHIGNLSGKIWTDHNVHDPGITILEVLVYALMDLGYKTNLPFEDVIAFKNDNGKDDNFLTPLEILTSNPVTITDYRKLVLEIKGVRNAWLEVATQDKKDIYLNTYNNTLFCSQYPLNNGQQKIELNGLYRVYIEKEKDVTRDEELIDKVKTILNAHRNICEDFTTVEILTPIEIGICLKAELHEGHKTETVYKQVFKAIRHYIQPEIKYYTLEELLDKGRTIDAIFAGRPYREESYGFVDTEELENFDKREKIYLSDLYDVILNVDGVRKVNDISLKGSLFGDLGSKKWENDIPEGYVPTFSLEKTCIDLFNDQGALFLDKVRIHKSLSFYKKYSMPLENLDSSIPSGRYREDLEEYYSIQNDFPVVYGIGEDGLPDRATVLRKTQALQFKGYLMFYDQILANYTSQLANIRSLFSMQPEKQRNPEDKHTYFTQIPDSIPGIEDLLRFYDQNEGAIEGSVLAVPVANTIQWKTFLEKLKKDPSTELTIGGYCKGKESDVDIFTFSSTEVRTIYINQLVDSLFNENYIVEIIEDKRGYFFVIQTNIPDDVLIIGTKRYTTISAARKEAKNIAFIATMHQSYNLITNASDTIAADQHFFDIIYNPISYIDLIQELTENKEEYTTRRKQFLDHLLARFGEEFTEYTLLQYQNKVATKKQVEKEIDSQSQYVNQFAEVSRNRGKAFNYTEPSWNTDNVSGFEKRASLLSGIDNYQRRNLCNFEVIQSFRLILKDASGAILFRSNKGYESKAELHDTAHKVLQQLRTPKAYKKLEKNLNGFDAKTIQRIFSEQSAKENIIITKYNYHQHLCKVENDEVVIVSKSTKMKSEKVGIDKREDFVKNINTQTKVSKEDKNQEYRLLSLNEKNRYLDANALHCDIKTLITWKWHVNEIQAKKESVSETVFSTANEAWEHMIQEAKLDNYLTKHDVALQWKLVINQNISITGLEYYPDAYKAVAAWRQAKVLGSTIAKYHIESEEDCYRIELKNEKGITIAISNTINPNQNNKETILENCVKIFGNRNTKPEYSKERNKFGFRILGKDNTPVFLSYCVYDSEKEALQQIDTVFKLGITKKNYLLSGDQGNPEYNFILRDANNSFLALPPDHFETASDRTKALNARIRYFKDNTLPVFVKEEPRRYIWSWVDQEKIILAPTSEFSSKARAQSDFDKTIIAEAVKNNNDLLRPHCYEFGVVATPAQYKYVYGASNAKNELDPIFISNATFNAEDEVKNEYVNFVKKLPSLTLKSSKKAHYEFALYASDKKEPVAVQYANQSIKASFEKAKTVTDYIHKIYTKTSTPRENFIDSQMLENQKGRYDWRFYKKNMPLAISPYRCVDKEITARIKSIICDITPPINLKQCPEKEIVICTKKDPYKYHYQICYKDDQNNNFVLYSYIGYTSYEAAEKAYHKEWLEVIKIAENRQEYQTGGRISINEIYKNTEDKTCNDSSFIAVIPNENKNEIEAQGKNVIDHYVQLADIFPIYKVIIKESEAEVIRYKYKVVVPQALLKETSCSYHGDIQPLGTLLWQSIDQYIDAQKAIQAYQYLYNLAGTSNNCKILCEEGKFYVGLVEVLAESSSEFETEEQAWDDIYPNNTDDCENCVPGGVREFIYAAEEDKNYLPVCDQNYWKFKVVSPEYFVANHECYYSSEKLRDEQIHNWVTKLENLNWDRYLVGQLDQGASLSSNMAFLSNIGYGYTTKEFCDLVFACREGIENCDLKEKEESIYTIKSFLKVKYQEDTNMCQVIEKASFTTTDIKDLIQYFPVYKTEEGYRYRLYFPENDVVTTPNGLQPCGCADDVTSVDNPCNLPYPFISSNYYSCCTEALNAFIEFCALITSKSYNIECISKTEYGPYSFSFINKQKEIAYHPQQYQSLQQVKEAIQITKTCANDLGMHLLEHILLRPQSNEDCGGLSDNDGNSNNISCLLPICPDYDCEIDWQPDMDKNDPCANTDNAPKIKYTPGSDPYSFWATLVLPSWHKRFRTKENRVAFEKFLYKEAPALVGLHIVWVSPKDMCKFEDAYKKWLVWKEYKENPEKHKNLRKLQLCYPNDAYSPNCLLSQCIKNLKSEEVCPSGTEQQDDCNCTPKKDEKTHLDASRSLFWGYCPPDTDTITPQVTDATSVAGLSEKTDVKIISDPIKSRTIKTAKPKKATLKTKESKAESKQSKTPSKKAVVKKESSKKQSDADLTIIRKRKPQYLTNIRTATDTAIKKTKSYERTVFFLENTPTIVGYAGLVEFFSRYSLQKDNDTEGFLILLKNASWYLLDTLVLDQKENIKKEDLDILQKSLKSLSAKGMSLKELYKEWKGEELKANGNPKSLSQIKKILS